MGFENPSFCVIIWLLGDTMKKKLITISSIFVVLDQLLKIIVRNNIILGKEIFIIPNFFYLTNVENTGGAFSILESNTILLASIGIVVVDILSPPS